MLKELSDADILEAYDGDFEIPVYHKPTIEEIVESTTRVKLAMVARKAEQEKLRQVETLIKEYSDEDGLVYGKDVIKELKVEGKR